MGDRNASLGLVGLWVILGGLLGCTSVPEEVAPESVVREGLPLREDAAEVLVDGELARYSVGWGILTVGSITYGAQEEVVEGRPVWALAGETRASGLAAALADFGGSNRSWVDAESLLPLVSTWISSGEKPHERSVWFRQEEGRAWSGKVAPDFIQGAEVSGRPVVDPLSLIFLMRLLDPPLEGTAVEMSLAEGEETHRVSVRYDGEEVVKHRGEAVPCTRLVMRSDRLDAAGQPRDPEPYHHLFVLVARLPHRPILRMEGKAPFGKVRLTLEEFEVRERLEPDSGLVGWSRTLDG